MSDVFAGFLKAKGRKKMYVRGRIRRKQGWIFSTKFVAVKFNGFGWPKIHTQRPV